MKRDSNEKREEGKRSMSRATALKITAKEIYIYIYMYVETHIHVHAYIYMYVPGCVLFEEENVNNKSHNACAMSCM